MEDLFSARAKTLWEALGYRRFILGSTITLAVTLIHWAGGHGLPWLLDVPTWEVAVGVGFVLTFGFLMEYATKLRQAAQSKLNLIFDEAKNISSVIDAGHLWTEFSIRIKNDSLNHLRLCQIELDITTAVPNVLLSKMPIQITAPFELRPLEVVSEAILWTKFDEDSPVIARRMLKHQNGSWLAMRNRVEIFAVGAPYEIVARVYSADAAPQTVTLALTRDNDRWVMRNAVVVG